MNGRRVLDFCVLLVAAQLAGCGGASSIEHAGPIAESRPAPPKTAFPSASGATLANVIKAAEGPGSASALLVEPTAMVAYAGENRYPLEITRRDHSQVTDAQVALYISKVPATTNVRPNVTGKGSLAKAQAKALESPAMGPYPAAIKSLSTKPAFRADSTSTDPNAATVVYVAKINFPTDGEWRVAAIVKEDGMTTSTVLPSITVGEFTHIPRVGQKAPVIRTPTLAQVDGDLSQVTTRIPPDHLNEVDFASVVGEEPIVLLFASPKFSWNRVGGPVVDITEQVAQRFAGKAAFIHMELYKGNDPGVGVRPQVRAFHLPSEPWLFAIDQEGRIRAELEGAFDVAELTRIVRDVVGK